LEIKFYNQNRPHTVLVDKTPDEFYFDNLPAMQEAARPAGFHLRNENHCPTRRSHLSRLKYQLQPGCFILII